MLVKLFFILCFFIHDLSWGAPPSKIPLKVETSESKTQPTPSADYPEDSVDPSMNSAPPKAQGIWSLGAKGSILGGYFADQESIEQSKDNRYFLGLSLRFLDRSWHRVNIEALWVQNNNLIVSGSWEYVPSRKPLRTYYGLGFSQRLVSDKEFRNIIELENYYLTASVGAEYLLESRDAFGAELKGLVGTEDYAVQLTLRYIISF